MIYMSDKKENKSTTSVKISIEGSEKLDAVQKRLGVAKIEMTTRLVDWFCGQDKTLQSVILGQIDPLDEAAVLDLIKARLKGSKAATRVAETVKNQADRNQAARHTA
jgi:hypothetical protein